MAVFFSFKSASGKRRRAYHGRFLKMAKNQNDDEVLDETMTDDVAEVEETEEEPETEATETEEEESEQETESEEPDDEAESEEQEEEAEPEKEPEKPNKKETPSKKKAVKKKQDEETDAELDAFFEKLRKAKEKQLAKEKAKKETPEKTFTQAEFEKALKSALAKRLPSKEEREQFEHWKESQQTLEEKMSVLMTKNSKLTEEIESQKQDYLEQIEKLKHENTIIKAGVEKDAVEFVQYKVEKMDGDFEDNLQDFLKANKRYVTPKTTIVEAAEHKPKVKTGITKKDLDKMGYVERAKFREEHPEEYARAMGR